MLTLPETYCTLISTFALVFSKRVLSFHASVSETEMKKVPRVLLKRFTGTLCYAT
jgi:hypothetical protein